MKERVALLILAALFVGGCDSKSDPSAPAGGGRKPAAEATASKSAPFVDISASAGVVFEHNAGLSGEKFLLETMHGGGGFVDVDGDGAVDIVLIDGGGWQPESTPPRHRIFRNDGRGRFEDRSATSGIAETAPGMGLAAGDIDNDGDIDLAITNYGPNALYLNDGDGTFTRSEASSAIAAGEKWSASAIFFDANRDGALDLYVSQYVVLTPESHERCIRRDLHAYCVPRDYDGEADYLFLGDGQGGFSDVSEAFTIRTPGTPGRGLGVIATDIDADGDDDLYVANDMDLNFLLRNTSDEGTPGFREEAFFVGGSASEDGRPEAGMGVDAADADGDGDPDLIVTNFESQTNAFYRNEEGLALVEISYPAGMGVSTLRRLAFGVRFFDYDLDGDQDLFVANGHVDDNAPALNQGSLYAQPDQLFENRDGKFVEILEPWHRPDGLPTRVGRALATGDIDFDGDLDVLVVNNNGPATLLENRTPRGTPRIGLALVGTGTSNRDAYGARVKVTAAGKTQFFEVRAGSSYLATNDPRLFIGCPGASTAEVVIAWPDGTTTTHPDLEVGSLYSIRQGQGVSERREFRSDGP